jgi:hypothetical protein
MTTISSPGNLTGSTKVTSPGAVVKLPAPKINYGTVVESPGLKTGKPKPLTAAQKKAAAAKKADAAAQAALNKYLGKDTTYQSQIASYNKSLADYQANMTQNSGLYNSDYASQLNQAQIGNKRTVADTTDSYAGRGILFSGLYGKKQADVAQDYTHGLTDMSNAKTSYFTGQQQNYQNFLSQQNLDKSKAKQDAIARRATGVKI